MTQPTDSIAASPQPDRRRSWLPFNVGVIAAIVLAIVLLNRNDPTDAKDGPTQHAVRAQRRQYIGAPPVIAHPPQSGKCVTCHTPEGSHKPPLGFAPANPHTKTPGMSEESRCRQCHAFRHTDEVFVESDFESVVLTNVHGTRAHVTAPPTIPHALNMRNDCNACHSGPSARPEIRCTHPERTRCTQCHVPRPVSGNVLGGDSADATDD